MSEWNWPVVFVYAFVITALVVVIIGFSDAPVESEGVFEDSNNAVSEYEPVTHSVNMWVSSESISPSRIDVRVGDSVVLHARSIDGADHVLHIPALSVYLPVVSGDVEITSFVVSEPGEFMIIEGSADTITPSKLVVTRQ